MQCVGNFVRDGVVRDVPDFADSFFQVGCGGISGEGEGVAVCVDESVGADCDCACWIFFDF